MSEEEIIQNVKRIIEHKVISNYINDNDSRAIQGLLDLYNKEKEKNDTLENLLQGNLFEMYKYYKDLCDSFQANNVSKDKIKFLLNGCDISFIAEAPKDITLEQLLKQCDKIKPFWCCCGVRNLKDYEKNWETDLIINYDNITKTNEDVNCDIVGE